MMAEAYPITLGSLVTVDGQVYVVLSIQTLENHTGRSVKLDAWDVLMAEQNRREAEVTRERLSRVDRAVAAALDEPESR